MKKTLLVFSMLGSVAFLLAQEVTPPGKEVIPPGLTNIISDIRSSPLFSRTNIDKGGTLAGFQVAGENFPEFPAIAINKVNTKLEIDNEPSSIYLSFDGGKTFLYLVTFYEAHRWNIYDKFPDLQVMALKVGTEPAPK